MAAPATIAEGVLGKEALHLWNGTVMNDLNVWPRIKIDTITGLHDRADADNNTEALTGRPGEIFYPSAMRGKTVTYTGRVMGRTLQEMRAARTTFLAALAANTVGYMVVSPPAARGGVSFGYTGRVLAATCDDAQERGFNARPTPHQREFVLSIRQNQPVYFMTALQSTDSATDGSVDIVQQGTAPADPTIVVNMAATGNLRLQNDTIDATLRFLDLPAGVTTINFAARTALWNGQDVSVLLDDVQSTWWDELVPGLIPGYNRISEVGAQAMQVHWYHTSY